MSGRQPRPKRDSRPPLWLEENYMLFKAKRTVHKVKRTVHKVKRTVHNAKPAAAAAAEPPATEPPAAEPPAAEPAAQELRCELKLVLGFTLPTTVRTDSVDSFGCDVYALYSEGPVSTEIDQIPLRMSSVGSLSLPARAGSSTVPI